jgi:hypothetical protein
MPLREYKPKDPRKVERASAENTVRDLIAEQEKAKGEASLSKTERRALERERKRQEARKAGRVALDVGEELKTMLTEFASEHSMTISQVAAWILWPEIKTLIKTNGAALDPYKVPAAGITHEWNLDIEKRKKE